MAIQMLSRSMSYCVRKGAGEKLISMMGELVGKSSKEEGTEFARALAFFQHSQIRDVQLAKAAMQDPILQAVMPNIYYVKYDNEQDKSFFVMERFNTAIYSHIDCIEGGSSFGHDSWTTDAIHHVLAGIATVHAKFLDNITALPEAVRSALLDGTSLISSSAKFMKIETSLLRQRKPGLLSDFAKETIDKIADNASYIEHTLQRYPKTLVHKDFSNRNCCLRRHPSKGQTYLCAYDWELATLHVPQIDVVQFLSFVLPLQGSVEAIQFHSKFYHKCLLRELCGFQSASKTIERVANEKEFYLIFDLCMMIFLAHEIMLYHAGDYHCELSLPYVDRVSQVATAYLKAVAKQYDFLQ